VERRTRNLGEKRGAKSTLQEETAVKNQKKRRESHTRLHKLNFQRGKEVNRKRENLVEHIRQLGSDAAGRRPLVVRADVEREAIPWEKGEQTALERRFSATSLGSCSHIMGEGRD